MGLLSVAYVLWHEYFYMQLNAVCDPSLLAVPCLVYQSTINWCTKFFCEYAVICDFIASFDVPFFFPQHIFEISITL
jgi:hypothetical protein